MKLCVNSCEWSSEFSVDTIGSDGSVKSIGKHGKTFEVFICVIERCLIFLGYRQSGFSVIGKVVIRHCQFFKLLMCIFQFLMQMHISLIIDNL